MAHQKKPALWKPILFGVLAILFTITVLVGWSVIFTQYYLLTEATQVMRAPGLGYWIILSTGCVFLVLIIATLVSFLVINVRQTLYVNQQNTFLDSVTHELKSPLASILLSLETLEMRQLSPARQAKLHGMMRKDIDRLQAFIEHVLEASRLEHNDREMLVEAVEIEALLDRCVKRVLQRHKVARAAITTEVALASAAHHLIIDPVAIEIILVNLLDNAVKYSPGGAQVTLRVSDGLAQGEESTVRFQVSDQGIGLERRQQKKVFRRFHRVKRVDHKNVRGTGLGLYVVRILVRQLKGLIQVESPGRDQVSSF
jgi:signal transduction histidine kinase